MVIQGHGPLQAFHKNGTSRYSMQDRSVTTCAELRASCNGGQVVTGTEESWNRTK